MIIVVVNVLYMIDFIYIKVCVYGNMERIWFYIYLRVFYKRCEIFKNLKWKIYFNMVVI